MAIIEIKVPSPGESISHVELFHWLVKEGDVVQKNAEIAELESDKATLMLVAEEAGKISLKASEGDMLEVGTVACTIDTSVQPEASSATTGASDSSAPPLNSKANGTLGSSGSTEASSSPQPPSAHDKGGAKETADIPKEKEQTVPTSAQSVTSDESSNENVKVTPLARKVMESHDISVDDVLSGLRRLKREDVEASLSAPGGNDAPDFKKAPTRTSQSSRLSSLRRKLSERLVSVKNETAMLTTFNEVDMKPIMDIRKKYQNAFVEEHGIKLGFMSFFLKACSVALQEFPNVNAVLDGENLVTYDYVDISVAVSAPKGLMVPVIRNVESLGLAEIEQAIAEVADKAREGRLSIPEMTGGTFTVTNGGIFGSMLSTPLINPPQSAILGMHNIIERPVAIDGQVVIRPMMYVALSYDHRVIDGKESVSFLVRVKQLLENPTEMLYSGSSAEKRLLDL